MVTGIFTRSSTQSTIKSALFIAIFGLLRAQLTLAGYVKQCGRRTHIAPLAPPPPFRLGEVVRSVTIVEIHKYVQNYAQAAADESDFDGVEIDHRHGYLVDQKFTRLRQ